MNESSHSNMTVAVVGNPTSNKGRGAKTGEQVISLLQSAGDRHGFEVIDVTGTSFEDSLVKAKSRRDEYDYLVVVGGDGMIALGTNAVGCSGKPLGIVATGSGNDFARGLELPVNRVETAVDGIVGAMMRGSHIDVDMGLVTSLPGGYAVDSSTGDELPRVQEAAVTAHTVRGLLAVDPLQSNMGLDFTDEYLGEPNSLDINRYYAGMLSCGLDASINDRANHSHLPNGTLRYFAAVLVELTHMKRYGYHIKATLADGSMDERDIISPLLTVANSRHIGGGIEVSPYSRFSDGLLDLIWMDHVPNFVNARRPSRTPTMAGFSPARYLGGSAFAKSRSVVPMTVTSRRCSWPMVNTSAICRSRSPRKAGHCVCSCRRRSPKRRLVTAKSRRSKPLRVTIVTPSPEIFSIRKA